MKGIQGTTETGLLRPTGYSVQFSPASTVCGNFQISIFQFPVDGTQLEMATRLDGSLNLGRKRTLVPGTPFDGNYGTDGRL